MRIVPFPHREEPHGDGPVAELERALHGADEGPAADSWRALREDVRALAPPMDPQFAHELRERTEQRAALGPRRGRRRFRLGPPIARVRQWLRAGAHAPLVGGTGVAVVAAIVALVVIAPWRASDQLAEHVFLHAAHVPASSSGPARGTATPHAGVTPESATAQPAVKALRASGAPGSSAGKAESATDLPAVAATGSAGGPSSSAPSAEAAPARVQQRAAAITLAATPEAVQSLADQVARLAVQNGGFVQSSQVHLQRGAGGEASIDLSLPSARLSGTLASLAQLAPMRAESQSLQDITDEYGAARTKLADAVAERQALLRALARASTQGEIESLHRRLSLAGGAIVRARTALSSVSKRGSSSAVEVTVLGDAHASGGGLTLGKALHDAGDVLRVALAVLIIAFAVLVPLAILLALLLSGWRASRRRLRERALS